jgi:hypothetical protein
MPKIIKATPYMDIPNKSMAKPETIDTNPKNKAMIMPAKVPGLSAGVDPYINDKCFLKINNVIGILISTKTAQINRCLIAIRLVNTPNSC